MVRAVADASQQLMLNLDPQLANELPALLAAAGVRK